MSQNECEAALAKVRQERDRQYEFNIGQIATQAALEQQLSEAREERDRLRDWKQTILGFNGDPMPIAVERFRESEWCRVVVKEWKEQVNQQAATISTLTKALGEVIEWAAIAHVYDTPIYGLAVEGMDNDPST